MIQLKRKLINFTKNIKMGNTGYRDYHSKEYYNKILFESENFIVIPSLGSIVEGWLLIVPKIKYLSLQCIDNDMLLRELDVLSISVGELMLKEFGCVTMFEHGAVLPNSSVGCGVDFAHLHLVPIEFDLIKGIEKFIQIKYEWKSVSGLIDAIQNSEKGTEYLFLKDYLGNSYIAQSDKIQSQLFRKVIAFFLEIPEKYDWKLFHEIENISKTIRIFEKYRSSINLRALEYESIK